MKRFIPPTISFLCFLLFFSGCRTEKKEYASSFSKQYPNKTNIEVLRKDHYNEYYGFLSGIHYGGSHSFEYEFILHPDKHKWTGVANQIPRKLLFCEETIYLSITEERVKIDTLHPSSTPAVRDTTLYFKNVDERYFFRLFGDQFFVPIDSIEYLSKKNQCIEEVIPFY